MLKGLASGALICTLGEGAMSETTAAGGLPRCAPEEVGISSAGILRFLERVEEKVGGLHGFMLLRHGKVAAEGWWKPYGPRIPHMLFSLSKSFTSMAVGLAVHERRLRVTDRVLSFFPDQSPAAPDRNLQVMQVRHLLTMTTGHASDTLDRTVRASDQDWVRTFLSLPVEHEPGTHFAYNSGATYMLSAIVQKLTGRRVLEYLRPRLFAPLGIKGMTWQTCPKGINTGGWGLSVKTEDIARFGQLCLQRGMWQGRSIVPESWIAAATSRQVANGDDPNNDWAQGYGYQFWRCRHNAYRGDGAFGQFCLVMPDQDAVLAITSGVSDMGAVLNGVWECLLPAIGGGQQRRAGDDGLGAVLARLEVRPPEGSAVAPEADGLRRRQYAVAPNDRKIRSASFTVTSRRIVMTLENERGKHALTCGMTDWVRGATALEGDPPAKVATRGAWSPDGTLTMRVCFYETPFVRTITFRGDGDEMTLSWKDNVGFGPTEGPTLRGKAVT